MGSRLQDFGVVESFKSEKKKAMFIRFFVLSCVSLILVSCSESLHSRRIAKESSILPCIDPKISEKVLICGVCRNIEEAIPNTRASVEKVGSQFADYRVIIYENNSTDNTKELLRSWEKEDPRLLLISEQLSAGELRRRSVMKITHRIEKISMARNLVLAEAMDPYFDDYKYVIWADLDFLKPWDVDGIVETILHPEKEWDAVFAYGAYDLFALRSLECPIGFELLGSPYWSRLDEIRKQFVLHEKDPWKKVYSAFGGLGIYKREAIRGCSYSPVVTKDLEKAVSQWISQAKRGEAPLFLEDYEQQIKTSQVVDLSSKFLSNRKEYPDDLGVRMPRGKVVWFSCTKETTLPWTCEHLPFHATMMLHGFDQLYVNPRLHCDP